MTRRIIPDGDPTVPAPRTLGRRPGQACSGNDARLSDARETVQVNGTDVGKRRNINLIEGTNVTITGADDPDADKVDITINSSGGGGGGAPSDAEYLLAVTDIDLPNGRVLTNTSTIEWDVSLPGLVSSSIPSSAITTTHLGGDITTAGKALLDDLSNTAQRSTLGLGNSAVLDVGIVPGTVAAGDDSRLSDPRAANAIVTGGSPYAIGAINDGEYVLRSGSTFVGGTPSGGSGDDTIYANAPNQSINMTTTYEVLCSKSVTIAVNNQITVEVYGSIFNNTAATQTYRWQLAVGSATLELIDGTTIASSATNYTPFAVKGVSAISSTTNSRHTMESIRSGPSLANTSVSTSGNTIRMSWNTSGTNLTGAQTVELRMRSATSTANQSVIVHAWSITQTPQRL